MVRSGSIILAPYPTLDECFEMATGQVCSGKFIRPLEM